MKKVISTLVVSLILGIYLFTFPSSAIAGRRVIGHWIDNSHIVGAIYKIYIENDKTYLSRKFPDGSRGVLELVKDARSTGRATYSDLDDRTGDYYVINKRGFLEIWDSMGLIVTMKPVR